MNFIESVIYFVSARYYEDIVYHRKRALTLIILSILCCNDGCSDMTALLSFGVALKS